MATAGPNYPATVATSGPGSNAWTNPNNIKALDSTYATCNMSVVSNSDNLDGTNLGFAIPTGSAINGIVAEVIGHVSINVAQTQRVYILKSGSQTDGGDAQNFTSTTDTTITHGTSTSLWGTTWTYSDINSSTVFGVRLLLEWPGSAYTASIDAIRITVTYTPASGGPSITVTRQAVMRAATR